MERVSQCVPASIAPRSHPVSAGLTRPASADSPSEVQVGVHRLLSASPVVEQPQAGAARCAFRDDRRSRDHTPMDARIPVVPTISWRSSCRSRRQGWPLRLLGLPTCSTSQRMKLAERAVRLRDEIDAGLGRNTRRLVTPRDAAPRSRHASPAPDQNHEVPQRIEARAKRFELRSLCLVRGDVHDGPCLCQGPPYLPSRLTTPVAPTLRPAAVVVNSPI